MSVKGRYVVVIFWWCLTFFETYLFWSLFGGTFIDVTLLFSLTTEGIFVKMVFFLQKIKQNMFLALILQNLMPELKGTFKLLLTEPLQDPKLDVGIRNRSVLHQQGAGQFRRTTYEENVKIVCEALFQSPGKSVKTASTVINAAFYRS